MASGACRLLPGMGFWHRTKLGQGLSGATPREPMAAVATDGRLKVRKRVRSEFVARRTNESEEALDQLPEQAGAFTSCASESCLGLLLGGLTGEVLEARLGLFQHAGLHHRSLKDLKGGLKDGNKLRALDSRTRSNVGRFARVLDLRDRYSKTGRAGQRLGFSVRLAIRSAPWKHRCACNPFDAKSAESE